MTHHASVEIRLTGKEISPGRIRSREIAVIIDSFEDMISSFVIHKNPQLKKEDVVVGLKSIREGSIRLEFSPNLVELTLPAARRISESISENDFGALPSSTISSLKKLSDFTRRHQCNAEILTQNGILEELAVITPTTEIPDVYPLSGETTLYGEITRVGGEEPKIRFKTIDNQVVYCSATRTLAKEAGVKLYTQVGLRGIAEWNTETFEIEAFRIISILDYEEVPLPTAFSELAELIGESVAKIDDVDRFVDEVRYEDSEV